jgi:hypothetical protein
MSKFVRDLFDRLAARFAAIFGKLMSSSVQTLHAEQEAECQSRLEDLARRYEADGKPEIAACLRQRARLVITDDPATLGAALLDKLGGADSSTPALSPVATPLTLPEATHSVTAQTKPGRRRLTLPSDQTPPVMDAGDQS